MKRMNAVAGAVLILASGAAIAPQNVLSHAVAAHRAPSARSQTAASLVKPQTFISLDAGAQGKEFEAGVVVAIQHASHMNAARPSEAYLIPTTLTATPPAG